MVDFVILVLVFFDGDIDELQDQGTPSDNTAATGEEVSADDVLKDRRFARRLRSNDDNLREVERIVADGVEDQILELVDGGEEVIAEGGHLTNDVVIRL